MLETITIFAVCAAIFWLIERLMTSVFDGFSSAEFPTHEAYMARFLSDQLRCREMHIAAALFIGCAAGFVDCWFNDYSPASVVIVMAAMECAWLLLTYVLWRPADQSYMEWRQLFTAAGIAALCGWIAVSVVGVAMSPLLIAGGAFAVVFVLMIPL